MVGTSSSSVEPRRLDFFCRKMRCPCRSTPPNNYKKNAVSFEASSVRPSHTIRQFKINNSGDAVDLVYVCVYMYVFLLMFLFGVFLCCCVLCLVLSLFLPVFFFLFSYFFVFFPFYFAWCSHVLTLQLPPPRRARARS